MEPRRKKQQDYQSISKCEDSGQEGLTTFCLFSLEDHIYSPRPRNLSKGFSQAPFSDPTPQNKP